MSLADCSVGDPRIKPTVSRCVFITNAVAAYSLRQALTCLAELSLLPSTERQNDYHLLR